MKATASRNEKNQSGQVKSNKLVGPKDPVEASPLGLLVSATLDEFIYISILLVYIWSFLCHVEIGIINDT